MPFAEALDGQIATPSTAVKQPFVRKGGQSPTAVKEICTTDWRRELGLLLGRRCSQLSSS